MMGLSPLGVLCVLAFSLAAYLFAASLPIFRARPTLKERMARLEPASPGQASGRPVVAPLFGSRMLGYAQDSLGRGLVAALARVFPARNREIARRLALVRPDATVQTFYGECLGVALVGAALVPIQHYMVLALTGARFLPLWLALFTGAAGFAIPYMGLAQKVKAREVRMLMSLPTVLDVVAIGISAGYTPQQALREVAREGRDEVSRELGRALVQTSLSGRQNSLVSVLESMAERNGLHELSVFVAQVRATETLGLDILPTLRAQAEGLREWKRRRIVEAGGKAGIKMVIPIALILPVLFVVVLLPAVFQLLGLGL